MCLATPMRIEQLLDNGRIATGSNGRRVKLSLVKNCQVGEFVLVQSDLAIEKISQKRATDLTRALKLKGES